MRWESLSKMGICWKCLKESNDLINFKSICDHCSAYLHTCVNCNNYCPGKPNDCLVPNTDQVRDRESFNYCEEFEVKSVKKAPNKANVNDVAKRLFKDD